MMKPFKLKAPGYSLHGFVKQTDLMNTQNIRTLSSPGMMSREDTAAPKKLDSSLKSAVKGTALIFAGTVAGNLLWFAIKILIVRKITVDEFGLYSLAITIPTVLAALAALGTGEGTVRNITVFLGQNKRDEADSLARASLQINILSSAAAAVLLFLLAEILASSVFYKPALAYPLRILALTVPFFTLIGIHANILRAHGFVHHKIYYQDIGHPLYYFGFLCLVFLSGFTFYKLIYAFTLAVVLVYISLASYEYKKLGIPPLPLAKGNHYRELLVFSLPLLIAGISSLILNWTDTLMLGRYMPPESVGIYNVSLSLARLMLFILGALGFMYLPLATELHAREQKADLRKTYQVLTKWVFAATFPLFFILFFFPEMTISFLFGGNVAAASVPLRILAIGFLFHVFMGPNGLTLMALGRTRTIMKITIFGAVLNVILNYILIKRLGFGVTGASVATLVSYAAINLLSSTILYRVSGVHPFTLKYVKPVIGASVIGLIIYIMVKQVFFAWWMMPGYLILFIIGYGASLLISGSIEKEDMLILEGIEKRTGTEIKWLRRLINLYAPRD